MPNTYSTLTQQDVLPLDEDALTDTAAYDVLSKLAADSATGPDKLPTRILKRCAAQLATPLLF